jgi:hypothetical protein
MGIVDFKNEEIKSITLRFPQLSNSQAESIAWGIINSLDGITTVALQQLGCKVPIEQKHKPLILNELRIFAVARILFQLTSIDLQKYRPLFSQLRVQFKFSDAGFFGLSVETIDQKIASALNAFKCAYESTTLNMIPMARLFLSLDSFNLGYDKEKVRDSFIEIFNSADDLCFYVLPPKD